VHGGTVEGSRYAGVQVESRAFPVVEKLDSGLCAQAEGYGLGPAARKVHRGRQVVDQHEALVSDGGVARSFA
jgi:hypothetical protein